MVADGVALVLPPQGLQQASGGTEAGVVGLVHPVSPQHRLGDQGKALVGKVQAHCDDLHMGTGGDSADGGDKFTACEELGLTRRVSLRWPCTQ